jgi:TRAP-type C4-dicarboxylate transport system permease small subunit
LKVVKSVSRAMALVGTALLLPMMLLITADVFLRYAFRRPITGTAEIAGLMLVCMVLGVSWCALEDKHIKVDIMMSRLRPKVQAIIDSITLFFGVVTCVIMTWQGVLASLWTQESKEVASELLPLPVYPFRWIFVLGLAMLCVVMLILIIQKMREAIKG